MISETRTSRYESIHTSTARSSIGQFGGTNYCLRAGFQQPDMKNRGGAEFESANFASTCYFARTRAGVSVSALDEKVLQFCGGNGISFNHFLVKKLYLQDGS